MSHFELAIVLFSALIHAVWSVFIKDSRVPLAFNLIQALPLAVLFIPLALNVDLRVLSPTFWWMLAATGLAHALYLYWLSLAYERADLSLVYPIARSTPAFLPLLAVPLLGETITLAGAAGIATVVAGMWAVQLGSRDGARASPGARRFLPTLTRGGMIYAYLTLATTVAYGLTDKVLMTELAATPWPSPVPRWLFCYFAMWMACAVLFVPMALLRLERGVLTSVLRQEWRRATTAALISVLGYGMILKALETAPASYVVAVRQSSVLFVVAMSVLFLRERPGWLRTLGAVATLLGVALIARAT
jgi:drug/metabolite transporter (DMT)-like permease